MLNYQKRRHLAIIGKAIYEEKVDEMTFKKTMPVPEAEVIYELINLTFAECHFFSVSRSI